MWHIVDTKMIQSLDNESEIKLCMQTSNRKNGILTFTNISVATRRALQTPSCENTRITTSCWTIIDRKTLELTKEDTPHPNTKEKPQ